MIDGKAFLSVKDPSGEMQGTVHSDAMQEHPNITIGAVLVLSKVAHCTQKLTLNPLDLDALNGRCPCLVPRQAITI